ncbi:MAG: phosphoribosylanthranilate isomerase [Henriciella sp.]|nr:phosphoribosylanthranilate isomerase [Henriciella sp.]
MTQVKICGLTDPSMVRIAAEAGADWLGFVLYPKSPRNLLGSGADALDEVQELSQFTQELGVLSTILMVDPSADLFEQVLHDVEPNAIQLHGKETPEQVQRMWRDCTGICELWKALGVSGAEDLQEIEQWRVDRLLIDAKPPEGVSLPGGNGEAMDWSVLEGFEPHVTWLLAGGLTPENVAEAITITGAPAVDVSSGVERMRGVKDEDLIRAFIDAVRDA